MQDPTTSRHKNMTQVKNLYIFYTEMLTTCMMGNVKKAAYTWFQIEKKTCLDSMKTSYKALYENSDKE